MSETPNKSPELTPLQESVFNDIRSHHKELFTKATSFRSLPELVREWAVDSGWQEETGGNLADDPFLIGVYFRTSAVIRYANTIVGEDTDNYRDSRDLNFHKDLISISGDIETEWGEKHTEKNWKKQMLAKIEERTKQYMESKKSSPGNQN